MGETHRCERISWAGHYEWRKETHEQDRGRAAMELEWMRLKNYSRTARREVFSDFFFDIISENWHQTGHRIQKLSVGSQCFFTLALCTMLPPGKHCSRLAQALETFEERS